MGRERGSIGGRIGHDNIEVLIMPFCAFCCFCEPVRGQRRKGTLSQTSCVVARLLSETGTGCPGGKTCRPSPPPFFPLESPRE